MRDLARSAPLGLEIRPLAGACGAEILGVDLAQALSPDLFEALHQALLAHGVIFFRGQELTPAEQLAFAANWGEIHQHPHQPSAPGAPGLFAFVKEPDESAAVGDSWHTDQMFTATPAMGTVLYAKEVPAFGGDTLFSNMRLAYDALSDGMKAMLSGATTLNRYSSTRARGRSLRKAFDAGEIETVEHPLFRRHPETGQTSLYLSYGGITRGLAGLDAAESAPILKFLLGHAIRPEFTCRFRWEPGSLAFWDNRSMLHCAVNDYPGQRREMHRVTIKGAPVIPAD